MFCARRSSPPRLRNYAQCRIPLSTFDLYSENVRNEYHQMVDSVQKAWSLVGDRLRDHGMLISEVT